jgi:hypothetical protein
VNESHKMKESEKEMKRERERMGIYGDLPPLPL